MNKSRTAERLSSLLAVALSGLFYIVLIALIFIFIKNHPAEPQSFNSAPVNLSFAQIELKAAEPDPVIEPKPVLEEIPPDPVSPEKADVAIEPRPEEPPPEPEPLKAEAQVTQESSAPAVSPVERNVLLNWVREQIEKEKYYPPAARNAGLEGTFRLLVKIGRDGKISEATVLDGKGHPMLRRSLENSMSGLIERDFGQPLEAPVELPFAFEFKLN